MKKIFYLLLLFIAGIYINSKKENILAYIKTELEDKLRGNASIGNFEVSVWKYFPSIAFEINDKRRNTSRFIGQIWTGKYSRTY